MNNGASLNRTTINGWLGDVTQRIQVIAEAQATGTAVGRVFRKFIAELDASATASSVGVVFRRGPLGVNAQADSTPVTNIHRVVRFAASAVAEAVAVVTAFVKPRTDVRLVASVIAQATADYVHRSLATAKLAASAWAEANVVPKAFVRSGVSGDGIASGVISDSLFKQIPWDESAPLDRQYIVYAVDRFFYVRPNMTIVAKVRQQPNDVQDYDITYDEWFPVGDLIASVALTCDPVPAVPPSYAIDPTKRVVKVWFYAGGITGTDYKVTVRATTTNDGNPASPTLRVKEAELIVKVREV